MQFEPIAIVGRSCILPGALSPEALWEAVIEGRDLVSQVPAERWRLDPKDVLGTSDSTADRTWTDRGGYVRGFERVWDPRGFACAESVLEGMDEGILWALHCAREALRQAGDDRTGAIERPRVSAIYGNLGFPSSSMSQYAEAVWLDEKRPKAWNRYMSGGSAALMRRALGLHRETFCLDTACASSLYALKLACDQLHDRTVDVALAGAVNRSDDLFVHMGFTALKAISPTGQSRPFHAAADGLLPAEGAGFLALKRLADARRDQNEIFGIVRGIGLSNDGRARGFLAPSVDG
ncbi:MAG: polyketide synthase, partial [Myxococcota bacterium]